MAHKVLVFAQSVVSRLVEPGDTVIDGTVGNGHDTARLARLVGPGGRVVGLDVQSAAISKTRSRLTRDGLADRAVLIRDSHERIDRYVTVPVRVAVFNLGYLPGSDHEIKTSARSSVAAHRAASSLLVRGGAVVSVLYRGHPGGRPEAEAVLAWADALPTAEWSVVRYGFDGVVGAPPEVVVVGRCTRPN